MTRTTGLSRRAMVMPTLLALLAAAPTPTAPAAPLAPVGGWTVEYADNMCALSHDFGTGPARPTVAVRPLPLGRQTELVMSLPERRITRVGTGQVTLSPSGQEFVGEYRLVALAARLGHVGSIVRLTLPEDAAVLLDATTPAATAGDRAIMIAWPPVAAAARALKTCQDDLLKTWGIDPAERARIVTPAEPKGGYYESWVSDADYPSMALDSGENGTITLLWEIGVDGRVHECRITASTGTAQLATAACNALRRNGRYTPAIGQDGQPMVSHATRRVVFRFE